MHISRWTDYRYFFFIFSFVLVMPIIMLISFQALREGVFDYSILIIILSIGLVGFVTLIFVGREMMQRQVLKEKKWIEELPFDLIAYPDFLVYRSYPTIRLKFSFHHKKPEVNYILDLMATLPYDINADYEYHYDEPIEGLFELDEIDEEKYGKKIPTYIFEINNPRASKFNRHRRWARQWIIKACDVHFQALHEKHPIQSITIGDGTKELDFEWWVRQKGGKWWM